jgi:cytoskeleton protein RodZ
VPTGRFWEFESTFSSATGRPANLEVRVDFHDSLRPQVDWRCGEVPREGNIQVGSFGERLRREREMRGVSLDDIADATKIGTRLLRALEEEHFELLPGGIFNKGFVRAYSKYLGLNEEEAVADYLEAAGETVPDPRVIAEQNSSRIDRSSGESGPSRQAGFPIIPVLILLLLIAAGAGGWQIYQERERDREAKRQAAAAASSMGSATPVASSPTAMTTPPTVSNASANGVEPQSTTGGPPPKTVATTNPSTSGTIDLNAAGEKKGDVTSAKPAVSSSATQSAAASVTTSQGTAANRASTLSTQTFEVTVRAKDSAWVSIKSDGKFAVRGIIRSPDVKTVRANDEVVVWTGNAGAVEVSFNGQAVPLAGGPNQEGVLVFNSRGVVAPKLAQ